MMDLVTSSESSTPFASPSHFARRQQAAASGFETSLLDFDLNSPISALATDLSANLAMTESSPEIPFSPIQSLSRLDLCKRVLPHSPLAALSKPLKSRMQRHNTAHPRLQTQLKQVTTEVQDMEVDTPETATESLDSVASDAPTLSFQPNYAPVKPKAVLPSSSVWRSKVPAKIPIKRNPSFTKPKDTGTLRKLATLSHFNPHDSKGGTPRIARVGSNLVHADLTPKNQRGLGIVVQDDTTGLEQFFSMGSPPRLNINPVLDKIASGSKENEQEVLLPTKELIPSVVHSGEAFPRITGATLAHILSGGMPEVHVTVLDCRYAYEFEGGHVSQAIHVPTIDKVKDVLGGGNREGEPGVYVLHCEFSAQRAPHFLKLIRNWDRQLNAANYPHLSFPHLYILDGGYYNFWMQHKELCNGEYVAMEDARFKDVQKQERRALGRVGSNSDAFRRARIV